VVATCGGAFLGVAPVVGGIGAAVWIVVFALFRCASVASIAAALSLPAVSAALGESWPVLFAGAAALAVLVLHRANSRLRAPSGTETRFRFRKPAPAG
jgi:acyl phosphate:glycerol-3-phosphate acyltransferase